MLGQIPPVTLVYDQCFRYCLVELGEDEGNYIQVHADEHGNLIQDEDGNLIQYVPMEEDEAAQEEQEEVSHQHVEQIVDEHGEVCAL